MINLNKYDGIYRGNVVNNVDPMQLGRIQVTVPDVGGLTPSTWVMPSAPIARKQMGIFVVPQVGSGVWIQFEAGEKAGAGTSAAVPQHLTANRAPERGCDQRPIGP